MGACNKTTDEAPVTKDDLKPPLTGPTVTISAPLDSPITPVIVVVPTPPEVEPLIVKASLQLPGSTSTDTSNTPLPPVFYVIVGRGPASVIDHATLQQTDFGKDRMNKSAAGSIPVLHIGFSNPWAGYFSHGMGQPSYLLGLPGFFPGNQPGSRGRDDMKDAGLTSTTFGRCVNDQNGSCIDEERRRWSGKSTTAFEAAGWPELNGWVVWVQTSAREPLSHTLIEAELGGAAVKEKVVTKLNEAYPAFPGHVAPYRLLVLRTQGDDLALEFVYAQFVDFCTGSGRARQDRTEAAFKTARLEPWRDPASWTGKPAASRKIAVAIEAVRQEFDWQSEKRACIANGGAIALNAAERARDEECWTDWFHNGTLLEAFNNPRNFTFIKSKNGARPRTPDEDKPIREPDLIAADERTRLGRYAQVSSVTEAADCDVKLAVGVPRGADVAPIDQPGTIIREYSGTEFTLASDMWGCSGGYKTGYTPGTLPSTKYNYLILHGGLVTDLLGQPIKTGITIAPKAAPGAGGAAPMVCLGSDDGAIRVLGAAAQFYIQQKPMPSSELPKRMWDYRNTLPISAVPDGFILSGINIANANEFFRVTPNRNVNTMTEAELTTALADRGFSDAADLAQKIIAARNLANGYRDAVDLMAKVTAYVPFRPAPKTTAEAEIQKLREKHENELKDLLVKPQSKERDELIELKQKNFQGELALWQRSPEFKLERLESADKDRLESLAAQLNRAIAFSYE
jgi:hypothetical protein